MKHRGLATPWPFPFVPHDQLDVKLVNGIKGFLTDLNYPRRDLDYVLSHNEVASKASVCLMKNNAKPLFNLMLAAKGCDLLGGLYRRWYGRETIGECITELDVNQILIAHPRLDLKGLVLAATDRMFNPRTQMGVSFDQKRLSPADMWFVDKTSIEEDLHNHAGYLTDESDALSDEQINSMQKRANQSAVASRISLGAFAFYSGHDFSAPNALLTDPAVLGLVDMGCSFEMTKSSLNALKDLGKDSDYSQYWHLLTYQGQLVHLIAPLAILFGLAPDQVATRVEQIVRYIWTDMHDFTDDALEFSANIRVLLMNVLWNFPEHWQAFGLTAGDMLGVDCTFRILKTSAPGESYRESEALRSFWRCGLIQKDGTGETYAKVALNALGKKHGLFDPRLILRKWGSCNPTWFKAVGDFAPALDEINFMMRNDAWHYALENNRLSHLFEEPSALQAIRAYLSKGGNANRARAATSLEKYPQLLDQILPSITKASQIPRLSALITLTPEQIMRLPEKLHAHLLAADLGI